MKHSSIILGTIILATIIIVCAGCTSTGLSNSLPAHPRPPQALDLEWMTPSFTAETLITTNIHPAIITSTNLCEHWVQAITNHNGIVGVGYSHYTDNCRFED